MTTRIINSEMEKNSNLLTKFPLWDFGDERADLATVGGKGASLNRLFQAGLPVPPCFFVTTAVYQYFVAHNNLQPAIDDALAEIDYIDPDSLAAAAEKIQILFDRGTIPDEIATAIAKGYANLPGENPAVAVRSSATAEDLPEFSFAGQQDTYLNITSAGEVLYAVKRCWASLWTPRAIAYRKKHGFTDTGQGKLELALAIIVQLMVQADAAGILFTANPLNGHRDQSMINAAWGLGESVVGGQVSPDTLIVDKATGNVLERKTAEKEVMTVCTAGSTREEPVPLEMRHAPVLNDQEAARLIELGQKIEKLYEIPMDIEWARFDGQFAVLQARPITALPEVEPDPPDNWQLPPHTRMAMRNNIVEMMSAPLTPLFSTLGLAAVNSSMSRILADFFGRKDIMPAEIIITVNKYAYYNGTLKASSIAQILWGSIGIARRMFTGAVERWTVQGRPKYWALVDNKKADSWADLPDSDLLEEVRQLEEAAIDAYGALVSGVIPAAWISEGLFTLIYSGFIKRKEDPQAAVFLLGFNSVPILAEKELFDLSLWAREQGALSDFLCNTPVAAISSQLHEIKAPPGLEDPIWKEWVGRFQAYLGQYGHTITTMSH